MTTPDAPVDLAAWRAAKAAETEEAEAAAFAAGAAAAEVVLDVYDDDPQVRVATAALVAHAHLREVEVCPSGCHLRPDVNGFVVREECRVHGVIVRAAALAGVAGATAPLRTPPAVTEAAAAVDAAHDLPR